MTKFYKLKTSVLRLDLFDEIYLFHTILNYGKEDREYLKIDSYLARYTKREPSAFDLKINQFIQREILIPYPTNFQYSTLLKEGAMNEKIQSEDRQLVYWKLNLYSFSFPPQISNFEIDTIPGSQIPGHIFFCHLVM